MLNPSPLPPEKSFAEIFTGNGLMKPHWQRNNPLANERPLIMSIGGISAILASCSTIFMTRRDWRTV